MTSKAAKQAMKLMELAERVARAVQQALNTHLPQAQRGRQRNFAVHIPLSRELRRFIDGSPLDFRQRFIYDMLQLGNSNYRFSHDNLSRGTLSVNFYYE